MAIWWANLPSGIMTDKDDVVGKYATADLKVGDYILDSKLSYEPAAENAYLYNLDGTKQAISVTIKSFATGLSGKLESGDIVSVLVADYKGMGETVIPPELQYVEVISVTASSGYDANTGEAVEDEKELPSTVTLLVTTEQAKVLAGLEQESELHLALVYRRRSGRTRLPLCPDCRFLCRGRSIRRRYRLWRRTCPHAEGQRWGKLYAVGFVSQRPGRQRHGMQCKCDRDSPSPGTRTPAAGL